MPPMTAEKLQSIIEAALMTAGYPLNLSALQQLFKEEERPQTADIKSALNKIKERHESHESGILLQEIASGYRFQTKTEFSPWLAKLWEERPQRYSRAFLETLAIIAYKQPITRAEIEDIRGVSVSSHIMKTLLEREWVRVIGHREIPGRPAILGTTKTFLDHFNLASLTELPLLPELKTIEAQDSQIQIQLALENSHLDREDSENIPEERNAFLLQEALENQENI